MRSTSNVLARAVPHYNDHQHILKVLGNHMPGHHLQECTGLVLRQSGTIHGPPFSILSKAGSFQWTRLLHTLGPSLIRIAGIFKRSTALVFHQFGAPSKVIFSSVESLDTRSVMEASRKDRDFMVANMCSSWRDNLDEDTSL